MGSNWKANDNSAKANYRAAVRVQLSRLGEWAKHEYDGGEEWVRVNFTESVEVAVLGSVEVGVSDTDPTARGLKEDFDQLPTKADQRGYHSAKTGSRIIIRSNVYVVKDIHTNHLGEIVLPLAETDEKLATWDDELAAWELINAQA